MSIDLEAASKEELIAYMLMRYRRVIEPSESVTTIRQKIRAFETTREIIKKIGMKPW